MNKTCPHCGKNIELSKAEISNLMRDNIEQVKKYCIVCKKEFIGRKNSQYCSNACHCKAYRNRKVSRQDGD